VHGAKRKRVQVKDDEADTRQIKNSKRQSRLPFAPQAPAEAVHDPLPSTTVSDEVSDGDLQSTLNRIRSHPTLTPYRKRLYIALCSVPRGRYTTYGTLSDYLNSSARAVGSGMRNNPLAPEVPCHRVLAATGEIGGFGGSWGKEGEHAGKKVKLLREEGVRFAGNGKVIGEPFRAFHEFVDKT